MTSEKPVLPPIIAVTAKEITVHLSSGTGKITLPTQMSEYDYNYIIILMQALRDAQKMVSTLRA